MAMSGAARFPAVFRGTAASGARRQKNSKVLKSQPRAAFHSIHSPAGAMESDGELVIPVHRMEKTSPKNHGRCNLVKPHLPIDITKKTSNHTEMVYIITKLPSGKHTKSY